MRKWLTRFVIPLLLVLWIVLLLPSAGLAAQPALTITGAGLHRDIFVYPGDWSKYEEIERLYSSNNTMNYYHIWKVRGYDLFEIIGPSNLKNDQDYNIKFTAQEPSGKKTDLFYKINDLRSRYYYRDFTASSGVLVAPMIGLKRVDLYEYQDEKGDPPDPADVNWDDKPVATDDRAPRLYLGQAMGNVRDTNMTFFLYYLRFIEVGGERPVEEPPPGEETDSTTKPGGSTPGKEETKPSSPGSPDAKDDPEKEKVPGSDAKKVEAADKDNGDSELDKGTDEEAENGEKDEDEMAAAQDEEDNALTGEEIGEKPRKTRWPWIAAGAVVVVGLAGGGIYYYIRRKGA